MNPVRALTQASRLTLIGAFSVCATAALAGAPMVTEDADVLNPRECEWESTANRTTAGGVSLRTLSTKVGCGLVPGTQLALGVARSSADGASATGLGISGKTAVVPRTAGGFGLSVAYGFAWAKEPGDSLRYSATTLSAVATQSWGAVTVHGNLGLARFRGDGDTINTWALGAEYALSDSVSALAETYGSEGSKPLMGVGLRWQASTDWTLGLMASQSRDTPKARDVLLSAKMAF